MASGAVASGLRAMRGRGRGGPSLRRLLIAVAAGWLTASTAAAAQTSEANWWESIPGFGSPRYSQEPQPRQREFVDPMDDLRADAVPYRSDQMLQNMDAAIDLYQRIVTAGGWTRVPPGRSIRPGEDDERLPLLRRRLRASGDLDPRGGSMDSYSWDFELDAAVRRFQSRHGLRPTGRVDQPTFAALNVSAESRLAQLRLNQQRVRDLLNQRVEERYVLVNAAAYQLEAVERHEVQLRHRVIVGRQGRETPQLRATIRGLNFFPYWRVPDSVAHLDLIPRLRKEPDYLAKEQIRVYTGQYGGPELDPVSVDWNTAEASKIKFRQDPGPQNALGLVRIDMPNEHGVYMHDTPLKKLFDQRGRSFSAGCVRVQGVFQLAEWIAKHEPGWERPGRVEEVLSAGQALDLNLTRPVPVYFAYITAWAEANGRVEFRADIYGRDGAQDLATTERDPDAPPPTPGLAP
jgi:murein L,D-transpeptidase YcbB/YkuD